MLIEERTATLRTEIQQEATARAEGIQEIELSAAQRIPQLQDAIQTEAQQYQGDIAMLNQKVDLEMQELVTTRTAVKNQREQANESLFEILKDGLTKLKISLEAEQRDR